MTDKRIDSFIDLGDFYLRGLTERDLEGPWYRWFNDSEVNQTQNKGIFPNTLEKQKDYFEYLKNSRTDVVMAIIDKKTNAHVGNVGLHSIDWVHRTAMLGIVIGEKTYWGKGWGKKAWAAITAYGFETLNLNKIWATAFADNKKSIRCAEASGFRTEGIQRSQLYKNGRYIDLAFLGVLRSEWKK